jgi:hypothetical protein
MTILAPSPGIRRANSLFRDINSWLSLEQGIHPQPLDIDCHAIGRAGSPKRGRFGEILKNSLLNSLFSVVHRALPDLQQMK